MRWISLRVAQRASVYANRPYSGRKTGMLTPNTMARSKMGAGVHPLDGAIRYNMQDSSQE